MLRTLIALLLLATPAGMRAQDGGGSDPLAPALRALADGDTAAAVDWLQRSHRRLDGPAGFILLGQVYRERGTIVDRLRSQQVLEDAKARFPDDMDVRMELGRTYYAQRFFPDAVACFDQVLRRDPRRCDAHYLIGLYHFHNWKRVNDFGDDLLAARRELRAVVDCDTTNADAAFKYLVARYALEDTSSAECTRMMRRFPDRAEFPLYRATLAFEKEDLRACDRDFTRGLELLDEETRLAYGRVKRIMTGTEQKRYASSDQDSLARAHWVRRDPDPTTAINRSKLEHLYRMFVCDALYSPPRSPRRGWNTDRGETFLKFGKPATIYHSLGDDPTSGRIQVWSYVLGGVLFQFLFVDEYLNGNPRIPASAGLTMHMLRESPAQSKVEALAAPIPGMLDVVAFRDDGMAATVYLAMLVDADSLRSVADMSRVNAFNVRTAWFDPVWSRAGTTAQQVRSAEVPQRREGGRSSYEFVRSSRIPFDRFHFACAFEDGTGAARALLLGEADASRFMGNELVLSDILLTAQDGPAASAITRGGERVWPRIDRAYRPGEMLGVYVEIYNLARVARSTVYDVRFAIYPGVDEDTPSWLRWGRNIVAQMGFGGQAAIAQTFRRQGSRHQDHEAVRIDIDRLAPGPYQLLIEVTDVHSGHRATSHTPFRRQEARVAGRE
ncbi:MAG: GWxTD domain-containing protein [Candidatus Krumholzibacteria bacterium]|nr:GWxTD domain-containing protein [Candidatus Krumholzibacteria bacterium]MDH4338673.1 GWxTD domain-containing protein [Candidatus Krumholzibacteria bacterium]MDH5271352.1 GWxTD domain-containing protein [Candidatus Krumholzibacteria bacterium]